MKAKISRWGNSLGLRLPKAFAEEMGIADGADVEISLEGNCLRVVPKQPKLSLAVMMQDYPPPPKKLTKKEPFWGKPKGHEEW